MKKFLAIIVLGLLLQGCIQTTTSEIHSEITVKEKTIAMPGSNQGILKELKKTFRKNGWKVIVKASGSITTTGTSNETINTEAKYKPNSSYYVRIAQARIPMMQSQRPIPCMYGNDQIDFDLSIINSKTGEEAFVAEGNDCTKKIIQDLENQLSAFWN
jgi:hypothetical protein